MTIGIVKDVTNPNYIKIQAKEPLPLGKYVSIENTVESFRMLLDGELDHISENNFYMKGDIDEVTKP